jgi:hypothetical protein
MRAGHGLSYIEAHQKESLEWSGPLAPTNFLFA